MKPKLIIFDMDGTMLDTEPISLGGMLHAAKTMGHDMPKEFFYEFVGRSTAHARRVLRERYGDDFDFGKISELHQGYINEYIEKHGIPVKKGLYDLLDGLDALGIKKCVATSTDRERAAHKLKLANIAHRFEAIVGGDDVAESKPNPEIFLKAAALCKTAPEECAIIEDSPAGAEGAYNAGIPLILVPDIAPLSVDARSMATAICEDLFEVLKLIRYARERC